VCFDVADSFPISLQMAVSSVLKDMSEAPDLDKAFWSPANEVLNKFRLDNFQIDRIFKYWQERDTRWNFDARAAVCQWFGENLDMMQANVPESHPRVLEEADNENEPLFVAAFAIAVLGSTLVIVSMILTYLKRNTKAMYYAQTEFLFLMQFGMLLTMGGAFTYTLSPSAATCGLTIWFTNLGYVLQLIPPWMRISAINHLAASGKRMERARLTIWKLYAGVAAAAVLVALYLLVWTLVDPMQEQFEYELTNDKTPEGDTIVRSYAFCGSDSEVLYFLQFVWRGAILVPACLIASLAMRVKEDMNDTKSLSICLFLRLVFLVAMLLVSLMTMQAKAVSDMMGYLSILLGIDTILAVTVYILPKFWASEKLGVDPLPDVFVHTTVAFLDITGFTAW
jgi:hypothetical protein